jgi:drug/metabolite transporter (DMT)-like permease
MLAGIIAGVTWALETIIISMAMCMGPLNLTTAQGILVGTLAATFLHDACSAIWALIYNGVRGKLPNVWRAFKTKSGKFVVLAATIGGPIGMTGYLLTVNNLGASIGAVASAIFPAIGTVLAYIFLKEKMKWHQWIFLILTLLGVYGLSYSPEINIENYLLGVIGALMCAFGWGIEAVILAKSLTDPEVTDEYALQIRQTTSALVYGVVILPIFSFFGITEVKGWNLVVEVFAGNNGWLIPTIVIAAFFATVSYLFYYKAITQIGASKSMALNVTYTAWAPILCLILSVFGIVDKPILTPLVITCTLVVLICGIFAAADFKTIFKKED